MELDLDLELGGSLASGAQGDGGAPHGGDLMALVKNITVAELNAYGAVTSVNIPLEEIPANSIPASFWGMNLGDVIESSGGTITNILASVVTSLTETNPVTTALAGMHTADNKVQNPILSSNNTDGRFAYGDAWTPHLRISVSGSGVTLGNLTGGAAGLRFVFGYASP